MHDHDEHDHPHPHGEVLDDPLGEDVDDDELDAETEARRQLALAQIRQYGDSALRLKAHEVSDFDDDLQRLIDRMVVLMQDARGSASPRRRSGCSGECSCFSRIPSRTRSR